MPDVYPDIIDGNSGNLSFNGWEFTRVFKVDKLVSAGWNMLIEATLAAGVPRMNDAHPSIIDAYVVDVTPESIPKSGIAATVIITYRQFTENYQVQIGSRIVTRETAEYMDNQDTGNLAVMNLAYTYPTGHILEGKSDTQGVNIAIQFPMPTFTVSRTEWLTIPADSLSGYSLGIQLTGRILTDRGKIFNSALNKANWSLHSDDDEGTWQVFIDATSSGNGFDWRVNYHFTYDKAKWEYRAVYEDPTDGQPVPDPVVVVPPTVGSASFFPQYRIRDFNLLGLR